MGAAKSVPVLRVICTEENPFKWPVYLRVNVDDLNLLPHTLPLELGRSVKNAVLIFKNQKFKRFRQSNAYYYVKGHLKVSQSQMPTYSKFDPV